MPEFENKSISVYTKSMMSIEIIDAVEKDDLDKLDELIENGVNINEQEPETGITAIHAAIALGRLASLDRILRCEFLDLTVRDSFGRSPVELALELSNLEIIDALQVHLGKSLPDDGLFPREPSL